MFAPYSYESTNRHDCDVIVNSLLNLSGCGNQVFELETDCSLSYTHTMIFNRYADIVFNEKNNKGFDAQKDGKLVPEGTYFYYITYQIKNEPDTIVLKGYLQIFH